MATSLPWYKEVSPTQKKALFAAWLGYVFDGFDYMLITYVLLDIQKEFAMSNNGNIHIITCSLRGASIRWGDFW